MRIAGKQIDGTREEVVVIPRQSGDIVFKARAVLDYTDFENLCPAPRPPVRMFPGGATQQNVEDPDYKVKMEEYSQNRFYFMIIKSLAATVDLEWETIKLSEPATWKNVQDELTTAGFSPVEIMKIFEVCANANGLNQDKIDEATKAFLAGQAKVLKE